MLPYLTHVAVLKKKLILREPEALNYLAQPFLFILSGVAIAALPESSRDFRLRPNPRVVLPLLPSHIRPRLHSLRCRRPPLPPRRRNRPWAPSYR